MRSRPSARGIPRGSVTSFPSEVHAIRTCAEGGLSFAALPFAACFAYSPAGSGSLCDAARSIRAQLKICDPDWLPRLAARVWLQVASGKRFAATFGARVVLVPVPGSAATQVGPWVGERLAWCLKEIGLAGAVWPVLQRRLTVRKSAFAPAGERPSVLEHYASFAIERAPLGEWPMPSEARLRLTLVDDVITRGRTLLAAADRLREAFPSAEIRAFALLRTLARDEPLRRLLDPCEGEVRWTGRDARRFP
jgi:hypothetical protein